MDTDRSSGDKGSHGKPKDGGKAKEEEKVVQINNYMELPIDDKPRIRWTKELHQIFVETVIQLGGALNATPRNIVRGMGIEGLTVRHVKSHLQKYRRQQEQAAVRKAFTKGMATERREALLFHATGYGRARNQTEVGTIQPVIPMQTATNLGGQFVEPAMIPCIGNHNWNWTTMPTSIDQGSTSSNSTTQNQMHRWLVYEEAPMYMLFPPAAEGHQYNSSMKVEESTRMIAPTHGSSSAPRLQIEETFLDLDQWPN